MTEWIVLFVTENRSYACRIADDFPLPQMKYRFDLQPRDMFIKIIATRLEVALIVVHLSEKSDRFPTVFR